MSDTQQEFFANAFQIQQAVQGVLQPSNATPAGVRAPESGWVEPGRRLDPALVMAHDGGNILASPTDDYGRAAGIIGYITRAMIGAGGTPAINVPGATHPDRHIFS